MTDDPTIPLIEALAAVWAAIRRRHPEVPPVVLLPAPAERGRLNVLGHFAALRWAARRAGGQALHEVVVVAEHLDRAAEAIVETLLHEAAHAMNFSRGIKDCSTTSQYHNGHFKAAAEEMGLTVTKVKHYGWALTAMPIETLRQYEVETRALEVVLLHRRKPKARVETKGEDKEDKEGDTRDDDDRRTGRSRKATCPCGFIIRVSKKTMDETTIRCESCGDPFTLV